MPAYELAQLNIGRVKGSLDSPVMADFVANLDRINALADASPGFLWRLKDEGNDATSLRPIGDQVLVNMSVWKDVDSLRKYVYRSAHAEVLRRRDEWFERMSEAMIVLWWVRSGHRPSVDEAVARLELLRSQGPTSEAFTFRAIYPVPGAAENVGFDLGDECPAT
jgi:hypothetical protein